jgi:uncharacterized protein (TIGR03000 family)
VKPKECDKIYCLFIYGTVDDGVAEAVVAGGKKVEALFDDPALAGKVGDRKVRLQGADATRAQVLAAIDKMPLGKNDSVFIFYCGHGATIKEQGQCLLPQARKGGQDFKPGEELPRKDITDALSKSSPRFVCFVTDSCATLLEKASMPSGGAYGGPEGPPAIVSIMLTGTGIFDVNSSSYNPETLKGGEQAFLLKDGGIFTKVFIRLASTRGLGTGPEGKVSWRKDLFPVLKKETQAAFEAMIKDPNTDLGPIGVQKTQTPEMFPHNEGTTSAPQAPNLPGQEPATIVVTVPAEARVQFDDRPTTSTGEVRRFVSPPLPPGRTFSYTVTATRIVDGHEEKVAKEINVRAGQTTTLTVSFPAPTVASR